MTAAIADPQLDTGPAPHSTPPEPAALGRIPRLVPVPDGEPPLDESWGGAVYSRLLSEQDRPPDGDDPSWRATPGFDRAPGGRSGAAAADRSVRRRSEPVRPADSSFIRHTTILPVLATGSPRGDGGAMLSARAVPRVPASPAAARTTAMPARGDRIAPGAPIASAFARPHRPTRGMLISSEAVPGWSKATDMGVRMTGTADLPPARSAGAALARALLEAFSGRRTVEQLRGHCAPDVFAGLLDAPYLGSGGAARLLITRVDEPADGVAELSAVFRSADHVRAMAMRMQGIDGRWRITVLQIG